MLAETNAAPCASKVRRVSRNCSGWLGGGESGFIGNSIALEWHAHFVYHEMMDVECADAPVSGIAAAIAEPARTRMLYALLDGRARTSTELAIVGEVSPSTASVHLSRLKEQGLVKVLSQGKHRYYSLEGESVARALEALTVVAGGMRQKFVPGTPTHLR